MARTTHKGKLASYEEKRRFGITPEPAPEAAAPETIGRSYMVHKHHARRLHYDLRLELEGALASWAIPKGPSLDPGEKRLAVETEDHPLAYGSFEGRIPEGEYGAGDSLIWDRGVFDTVPPGQAVEQRKKGHLHLRFLGEKLQGDWHLVRTRKVDEKQQWLFFKVKDETADPSRDLLAERPESVQSGRVLTRGPEPEKERKKIRPAPDLLLAPFLPPMLATLEDARHARGSWFETKFDGFRALAAVSHGRVAVRSRNGLDLSERFPHIADALTGIIVGDAVIDGEIAVLDSRGVSRFEFLQQGRNEEAKLFAFDLLLLDGKDLTGLPLEERRDLLLSLLSNVTDPLRIVEVLRMGPEEAISLAEAKGWEGVVAKEPRSRWTKGRSRHWSKFKISESQEFAVLGFTRTSTGGQAIGSLLLGVRVREGFQYVGKVGTGFSARERAELYTRLLADKTSDPPLEGRAPRISGATWVVPRLVAEVRFTEWTSDGRLRQPSLLGFRPDKAPEEAVRELPPLDDRITEREEAPPKSETPGKEDLGSIRLTHPERLLYPDDGITKKEVLLYYLQMAEPLLAVFRDRPLVFEHWNEGVQEEGWFHQNIGREEEPWMTLVDVPSQSRRRTIRRLLVDRPRALGWLAQHSILTIHMWSSRTHSLEEPDWVIFDLDPAEGRGVQQAIEVAHALHLLLDHLSLPSYPKTSGKSGLHVMVPLARGHTHRQVVDFALQVGRAVAEVLPEVTLERSKEKRKGRLYLDCFQNGYGKTIVAPYSLRGVGGAPVSAPLRWEEVNSDLNPAAYNLRSMPARLSEIGDLFAVFRSEGATLPALWTPVPGA